MPDRIEGPDDRLSHGDILVTEQSQQRLEARGSPRRASAEATATDKSDVAFVEQADKGLDRATVADSSERHDRGASRVAIGGAKLFDEQRYRGGSEADECFDDIVAGLFGAEQPDERRRNLGIAKPSRDADERLELIRSTRARATRGCVACRPAKAGGVPVP